MNRGADKEYTQNRERRDSYRTSYSAQGRNQSRPYSSRYDGGSSRYGAGEGYRSDSYRSSDRLGRSAPERAYSERRPSERAYPERRSAERPSVDRYSADRYSSSRPASGQISSARAFGAQRSMQRPERSPSRVNRGPAARAPQAAARPAGNHSAASGIVSTLKRYFHMVNADILGRRKWKLLPALYLAIACFYSEILLGLFCGAGLSGLIYKFFFAASAGLVLGGFALLFKQKIQRIIVLVELFLVALLFIVQCLLRREFQVYFSLGTILGTATDVMGNYGGDMVHSILTGLPIIILFLLPLAIYFIRTRKRVRRPLAINFKRIFAAEMIVVAFVMWALGLLSVAIGGDYRVYKSGFEITESSDTLGLLTGFRLNEKYAMFGDDASDAFETLEVAATVAPVPTNAPADVPAEGAAMEAPMATTEALAPVATPVPYGENALDLDFAAMNQMDNDEDFQAVNSYLGTLTPSKQNAYTGLFKDKNLIIICAEALSDSVIDPQLTPTLYRLAHNGIYFSQAYQPSWGGSTSTGEYSLIFGLVPSNSDVMADTIGKDNYFTMGSQMKRAGYNTMCFHNGKYTYYDRNITHMNIGYDQFIAHGNGLEELAGRYPNDEEMLSKTLPLYMNQQPFSVYYMTCDGHKPYDKNDDARVIEHAPQVQSVYPNRYQPNTLNYICYQMELEDAVTTLVAMLEEAGIADDTVICICSDHYPYGLNRNGSDYIPDLYGYDPQHPWERDHNSIIIWSGCLENENKDMACEISAPVYSLDIVPTLSNLFGLEYDSRLLVGRDVFSDEMPLVLWKNGSWVTDLGRYDAEEEKFYPIVPVENEAEYVQTVNGIVRNKKSYSKLVVNTDYFRYVDDYLSQKAPAAPAVPAAPAASAPPVGETV